MQRPLVGKLLAAGLTILVYFLFLGGGGLRANFSGDDLTNIAFLHGYGRVSLGAMLAQALSVFSPEYRPMGGLYYRTLYALFGLHPAPFRIAFFTLLIVNMILAALWYRRLSRSGLTVATSVLLFSFQPALAELYYNDGTIYDVLCAFFVLLLLGRYTRLRQSHQLVEGNDLLLILALYGAALGSKEMAISVPAVLMLYEVVFHSGLGNLRARLWPVFLLAMMTAVCMAVKILIPNQMNINPAYIPHYQPEFIGNSYLHYYRLLLLNDTLSARLLAGCLILAFLAAAILRNRLMLFGLLFANLTLLTVCTILPRAGFVWYIPLLGYALYGGEVVSIVSQKLTALLEARAGAELWGMSVRSLTQSIVFGTVVIVSAAIQSRHARNLDAPYLPEPRSLSVMLTAAKTAAPSLSHGSRILIESDVYPAIWWAPLFLLRLGYQDPTIWVERVSHLGDRYDPNDVSLYALRMRWDGSQYRVLTQPQASGPPVVFAVSPREVRGGQTTQLQFPAGFAGCAIDVAYRMPENNLMRGGVWLRWTELDAAGTGLARVNADAERGLVAIDRVRACGRPWLPSEVSFVIVP